MGLEPIAPICQQRIHEQSLGKGPSDSLVTRASFAQLKICGQQRGSLQPGGLLVSLMGPSLSGR